MQSGTDVLPQEIAPRVCEDLAISTIMLVM
jgi:hypothetical protein